MSTSGSAGASAQAQANLNPDLTTQEVAQMDQFLDDHKDIDKQLQAKPSLISDHNYLNHHKDLRDFLTSHPQVREELAENPRYFMQRENRFDTREDARADRGRGTSAGASAGVTATGGSNPSNPANPGNANTGTNAGTTSIASGRNPNPDLTNGEVVNFDRFLDSHPKVSRQLEDNPQLINDQNYLRANPQLQDYLGQHPQVRGEVTETPNYFMHREERLDARTDARPGAGVTANVGTDQDSARMSQWLADHKDVDKDLRDKPELMNDQKYIDRHKEFAEFLREHPELRERSRENPRFFMDRDRFEGNREMTAEHRARVDAFLDKHQDVAKDLHSNPALCNDDKYISRHKDLREFFAKNPGVRTDLAQNHQYFIEREQRMHPTTPGAIHSDKPADKHPDQNAPADNHSNPTAPPAKNTNPPSPTQQRQDLTPTAPH